MLLKKHEWPYKKTVDYAYARHSQSVQNMMKKIKNITHYSGKKRVMPGITEIFNLIVRGVNKNI